MKALLDLELLRTFITVVDADSFAHAGQLLGRTQASVSQHLQRLEQLAGVKLLQKSGRNKQLTDSGRELLRHARQLLALNDQALASLNNQSPSGVLKLGAPHDIAETLLPRLLTILAQAAPNLRIDIDVGRSPYLMEDLHKGKVDMIISTRDDAHLEGFLLRSSPVWWICSARFKYDASQAIPLVLVEEPSIYRRFALQALEQQGIAWRQAYLASNLLGIRAAVSANLGITARSMELLSSDMRVLTEADGLPPLPSVNYYLWIRPNNINPLVKQAYIWIKQYW